MQGTFSPPGSLTRGGGENVPGIPSAYATRNFTDLARGPYLEGNHGVCCGPLIHLDVKKPLLSRVKIYYLFLSLHYVVDMRNTFVIEKLCHGVIPDTTMVLHGHVPLAQLVLCVVDIFVEGSSERFPAGVFV